MTAPRPTGRAAKGGHPLEGSVEACAAALDAHAAAGRLLAHDLRGRLTVILGVASLLAEEDFDAPTTREFLALLLSSAHQMSVDVDRLDQPLTG